MRHHPLNIISLALAAGLTMSACDRRDDVPTAVINSASDPAVMPGTATTETADGATTTSPDTTIQQNPTGAGGVTTPGDPAGTSRLPGMTNTLPGSHGTGTNGTTGTPTTQPDGTVQSPGATGSGTGLNSGGMGAGGLGGSGSAGSGSGSSAGGSSGGH